MEDLFFERPDVIAALRRYPRHMRFWDAVVNCEVWSVDYFRSVFESKGGQVVVVEGSPALYDVYMELEKHDCYTTTVRVEAPFRQMVAYFESLIEISRAIEGCANINARDYETDSESEGISDGEFHKKCARIFRKIAGNARIHRGFLLSKLQIVRKHRETRPGSDYNALYRFVDRFEDLFDGGSAVPDILDILLES